MSVGKRWGLWAGALALIVGLAGWTAAEAGDTFRGFPLVRVVLNGQEVVSDVPAVIMEGRTLLPLRKMAELTGLNVDRWDGESNTVYLSQSKAVAEDPALASVNGETISQSELYQELIATQGTKALDRLIVAKLVDQAAKASGKDVTEADIDAEVAAIRRNLGGWAFQQALRENGLTMDGLRRSIRTNLQARAVVGEQITVSDEEVEAYFKRNQVNFDKRTVHARHILVATEAEAKAVKDELDQGVDFVALAKAKSIDPGAAYTGGDLLSFGHGDMVPEFEEAAFSLKAGEVSGPVKTKFGWHVIKVIEVEGAAPEFATLKEEVTKAYRNILVESRISDWLQELRYKATITNFVEPK